MCVHLVLHQTWQNHIGEAQND